MDRNGSGFLNYYRFVFTELADPRTNSWFLIGDPFPPLAILGMYLYFVLSWGPRFMEDKKPFELKTVLVIYNFFQVLLSTWLFAEALDIILSIKVNWTCQPVDSSTSPIALRTIRAFYIYFLAKMTELLDTVFFVLRKKGRQITFLHLYHHTAMPMISWGATKYYPGGHGALLGIINSFVHIVMYSYYMMAAVGPQVQKYLWWKKYITTLQMVQFGVTFFHNSQLLFIDCGYPRWSVVFTLPNTVFFYYLFLDFYRKSYNEVKKTSLAEKCPDFEPEEITDGIHRYSTGGLGISGKKLA